MQTLDFFKTAISVLAGKQEFGLAEDNLEQAKERILGTEMLEDHSIRVSLASDGMNLDQKIHIERELSGIWLEAHPKQRLKLYFKRIKGPSVSERKEPIRSPKPSPFGLKVQKRAIPGVRQVIVVASGKGGVGKSTVSTNIAVTLAKLGYRTGLFDADVYGPSAPTMLGLKGPLEVTAHKRILPMVGHNVKTVSFGFMSDSLNPVIWRGPLVAKAIEQFCYDVEWGDTDFLIVDLPPGTGDVQMSLIENLPIHGAIIVSTPQDIALIDAHKALTMFQKLEVPIIGMIENMSGFTCPHCGEVSHIFGEFGATEFSEMRKIPLLGKITLNPSIRAGGDQGKPASLIEGSKEESQFSELAQKLIQF